MVDESKPHEPHPVCEMYPEYEDGIEGITYTIDGVANDFFDDVEFGYTTVYFADVVLGEGAGVHGGGMLSAQPGSDIIKENVAGSSHGGVRGRRNSRRRLAPTTGTSTLLVVYAVPPDAQNTDRTSAQMADELFGDYVGGSDPVNARSQVIACSNGARNYIPACADDAAGCGSAPIVNGVIEVPITDNVSGVASGTVVNWVTTATNTLLSPHNLSTGSFTQVMFILPDAVSWGGAAAWAYLPGSVSAFRSSYSYRMGVQVHEFGHNIGYVILGFVIILILHIHVLLFLLHIRLFCSL